LARPAPALSLPLHAHLGLLAQRGRDLLSALTRKRLKRGAFRSLVDLQAAINRYLAEHNAGPRPFTWAATPTIIAAKLNHVNASVH
jgi:hypothetical protein